MVWDYEMSGIVLSLVVLRSQNMRDTQLFYQCLLGKEFEEEQHENGPKHYSCLLGEFILEIYPQRTDERGTVQLGFIVDSLEQILDCVAPEYVRRGPFDTVDGRGLLLRDPDGRLVYLEEKRT